MLCKAREIVHHIDCTRWMPEQFTTPEANPLSSRTDGTTGYSFLSFRMHACRGGVRAVQVFSGASTGTWRRSSIQSSSRRSSRRHLRRVPKVPAYKVQAQTLIDMSANPTD